MEGAAARGQSLGKSADVGSVEGVSPRPRRRLDLPATLPHDPSALRTFLAGAPVAGLKPGRREVYQQFLIAAIARLKLSAESVIFFSDTQNANRK